MYGKRNWMYCRIDKVLFLQQDEAKIRCIDWSERIVPLSSIKQGRLSKLKQYDISVAELRRRKEINDFYKKNWF